MSNIYDDENSLIKQLGSLPITAEYFDILDAVIENDKIDSGIKKQMIRTLFADSMQISHGSNVSKEALEYYKKMLERFISEDFTNLPNRTYQEIWQVVYNHFNSEDNSSYTESRPAKVSISRTKSLSGLICSKKLLNAFSNGQYYKKNDYVHIVESLLAKSEFSLSKTPFILEWFEDEKNDISTLTDNQKKKILWFISMPILDSSIPHDTLGLNDNRTKYNRVADIYSIFLDPRTLSIDDSLYDNLLYMCIPYDTGYSANKATILANNYKPFILHEVLSKADFTETQYSIILKYLHTILENDVLGIDNNHKGQVPFSLDELLHLSLIKISSDEAFLSLSDEELQERLDRITHSNVPVATALTIRDLNDDEEKSDYAHDFYEKYVQDHADEPFRQNRALRILDKIKDYSAYKFEKACSIYLMNPKQASKIIDRSISLSTEQLESYEYVIKRLKIEENTEEQVLNEKKINFLESVLSSDLISLYSKGVVVNFVELGLSFHDMGDDKVNLYATYCEKNGIELSDEEKRQSTLSSNASVTNLSVSDRMLNLLISSKVADMSKEAREYHAYDVLRTMTNEVLFESDTIKQESEIKEMVIARENKVKKIGRATATAKKYFDTMEKK